MFILLGYEAIPCFRRDNIPCLSALPSEPEKERWPCLQAADWPWAGGRNDSCFVTGPNKMLPGRTTAVGLGQQKYHGLDF